MSDSTNEEVKRKFREALDRKKQKTQTAESRRSEQAKVGQVHGIADHKREFRRKSG
ncbi:MAG: DUF5302 domain-containing protein [Mycobacteriaceae bacterium]